MQGIFSWQSIDKPGSVVDDHLSSLTVASKIKRVSACERITRYADLLAANRVYPQSMSP